jgi:hypothetical protein
MAGSTQSFIKVGSIAKGGSCGHTYTVHVLSYNLFEPQDKRCTERRGGMSVLETWVRGLEDGRVWKFWGKFIGTTYNNRIYTTNM